MATKDKIVNLEDLKVVGDEVSYLKGAVTEIESEIDGLDGGTTGQVLRKKSNADYDVEWASVAAPTDAQVETAVTDWLDDHPEATTTVDFSIATKVLPTVADMVADLTLEAGDNVATRGYYLSGDNGGFNYVVSSTHTGTFYITLANGLYANRLTEENTINVDTIGAKHYATKELAEADTDGMGTNRTIVQSALSAGFSVMFGVGWYAFNDYIQMTSQMGSIYGYRREMTHLTFPNGIGINFNVHREYDYVEIKNIEINALENCINVDATVYNVINSKFDYLILKSTNGSGFVAPPNNEGAREDDTCVWSCYFGHINAYCTNGSIAKNVKGLGNWFYYINMCGDTHIAFTNCDGIYMRFDTLTSDAQYAFYYDNYQNHGGNLTLIDFHFEAPSKAFVYFTDDSLDSSIGIFAIDSGCTRPQMVSSEIPWIKVARLNYIYHYGQYNLLPDESYFNMTALHGAIIHSKSLESSIYEKFKSNLGGKDGLKIYAGDKLYKFYTGYNGKRYNNSGNADYEVMEVNHALEINNMYGGRKHQALTITDNMLPEGSSKVITFSEIAPSALFNDLVLFKLTDSTDTSNVKIRSLVSIEDCPGKIITIRNDQASVKNIQLEVITSFSRYSASYGFMGTSTITIVPGQSIYLMLDYETADSVYKLEWHPFTLTYNPS